MIKSVTTILKRIEDFSGRLVAVEGLFQNTCRLSATSQELDISDDDDEGVSLPIKTMDDIIYFENKLKSKSYFKKMVCFINYYYSL